jgi:hypothetical protein
MIGARCTLCKKQRMKHSVVDACPVGKLSLRNWHPTNKLTPKVGKPRSSRLSPVAKRGGSERRKQRSVRREIKAQPCVACSHPQGDEFIPIDCAHVRGWQVSQNDSDWNQLNLCRICHQLQHAIGWFEMGMRFPGVAQALKANGWEFLSNESTGDWSMFNEKEVEMNRLRRSV